MWQRLLPGYYHKHSTGGGGGVAGSEGAGRPPRSPPSLQVQKERQQETQQQKQRMMLKLGRRPWRGKPNQSKPLHRRHHSSPCNSSGKNVPNDNKKKKETDTIARLLSLERHLETDSDELFCWTEYDEDDDAVKNEREFPMAVTADDIEQALARFDTAIQHFTDEQEEQVDVTPGIGMDTMTPPVPSIVSPNVSFHGDNHRECSITMIGPNILAGHNPISALSMYTEGDMTEMDNTDATINTIHTMNTINTINTMPSLVDNNTVTTSNTMPSLVDHSIATSTCTYNSMPSLLDHTVATNNTMPSLLDHTVTTVNTLPSMLDNSVTTLEYDDDHDHDHTEGGGEQVDKVDMTGTNSNVTIDMEMDICMSINVNMEMDMTVSTSGEGDEDTIAKAVNALLKDHHSRDFLLPVTRRRESSLLVARRDSCSTISTAPDTPESPLVISEFLVGTNSPHGKFKTTTTTKNPITSLETCQCPLPHCPRCSKTVWPLEFFFVHTAPLFPSTLPRIRKSKKFVPDPMNVGDFYGDDDEDIRFVPQAYEQDTPSSRTTSTTTTTTTKEQRDEEIVFRLSPTRVAKNVDKKTDDKDYHDDDDDDATSTISTWTDDQENEDEEGEEEEDEEMAEEDEIYSQVKSYSHRSGSTDIVSQMTAERTPKFKNKCNNNDRLRQLDPSMDDEWKENLAGLLRDSDHESRRNNHLFARYHDKALHSTQHALASGTLRGTAMTTPGWPLKPDRTTSTTSESLLAQMVRPPYAPAPTQPTTAAAVPRPNRLWRCPSMGLDGILPPLRHNLSFLIPPPPPPPPSLPTRTSHPLSGNFQVARIEI